MQQNAPTKRLAERINPAAQLLGLSRATIYRLIKAGELDLVKLSERASGITRASLARYANSRSIPLPDGF